MGKTLQKELAETKAKLSKAGPGTEDKANVGKLRAELSESGTKLQNSLEKVKRLEAALLARNAFQLAFEQQQQAIRQFRRASESESLRPATIERSAAASAGS